MITARLSGVVRTMAVVNRELGEDVYITSGFVRTAMDVAQNFGTGN